MKKYLFLFLQLTLLNCLPGGSFNAYAQPGKERLLNFLVAGQSKNWIGHKEEKNEGTDNIKFKFYRNGNVIEYKLDEDGKWNEESGKWTLSTINRDWVITISNIKYILQPHYASTDAREALTLKKYNISQDPRLAEIYTMRANGYN